MNVLNIEFGLDLGLKKGLANRDIYQAFFLLFDAK